jgi:F-box protein 21
MIVFSAGGRIPPEILLQIFSFLPVNRHSDVGPKALAQCIAVNTKFRTVACDESLWAPHYAVRYKHSEQAKEEERRARLKNDYRLMYAERRSIDSSASEVLDRLIRNDGEWSELGRMATELGLDAWDELKLQHDYFDDDMDSGRPLDFTRHYWSGEMRGVIGRYRTVTGWRTLVQPSAEGQVRATMETAIGGLSSFFNQPEQEVRGSLIHIGRADMLPDCCSS